jgi:polysaccharide pyruvyl transferase WcaK-like protein
VTRRRRVLAIGWFGENNLGDDAMLAGLLRLLDRSLGGADVTVATRDPAETAATFGTRTIRRVGPEESGFTNREHLWATLRSDLVTLGGGDLIREQADGVVPALNWLSRVRVALRVRRPVALVGISMGDLFSPPVIDRVSDYLRRIPLVAARDRASATRLAELGAGRVVTIGDLALEAFDAPPSTIRPANERPRIGVVFREILGRGRDVPETANDTLQAELAAALDRLASGLDAQIELIPFRTRDHRPRPDDDAWAGEALAGRAASGEAWVRHRRPASAPAFAGLAAGLDLIIAVRLHGAVLGAGAGRPVVAISYDAKTTGFLGDLGLADQALRLEATADEIEAAARSTLADPTIVDRTCAGVTAMREQTRQIEPLLARLAGGGPPGVTVSAG